MKETKKSHQFPFLTGEQIQILESTAASQFGISRFQLSEMAGYSLATWIRQLLNGKLGANRILIVVGTGNNGVDGLIAARWLGIWGAQLAVATLKPVEHYSAHYLETFKMLKIPIMWVGEFNFADSARESDLIVDCVFGTGLKRVPEPLFAATINYMNQAAVPIISADLPSGLIVDDELGWGSIVNARFTLTFGSLKLAFLFEGAMEKIGQLILADVGIPVEAYHSIGLNFPRVFLSSGFLKVNLGQFESIKQKVTN